MLWRCWQLASIFWQLASIFFQITLRTKLIVLRQLFQIILKWNVHSKWRQVCYLKIQRTKSINHLCDAWWIFRPNLISGLVRTKTRHVSIVLQAATSFLCQNAVLILGWKTGEVAVIFPLKRTTRTIKTKREHTWMKRWRFPPTLPNHSPKITKKIYKHPQPTKSQK